MPRQARQTYCQIHTHTHTAYIFENMAYSCFSRIFNKVTWPAVRRLQQCDYKLPHKGRTGADNGGDGLVGAGLTLNVPLRFGMLLTLRPPSAPPSRLPAAAAEWRPDCLGNNAYREKYCIYVQQQLLTLGISWHQLRIERLYRGLIPPQAGPVFPSLLAPLFPSCQSQSILGYDASI